MELFTLIFVPTLTALVAPFLLKIVSAWIEKRKEAKAQEFESNVHGDDMAQALRAELRQENLTLKERNSQLEHNAQEDVKAVLEGESWRRRYFAIKKENQRLEFELELLKQELNLIRRQYEEYVRVRGKVQRDGGLDQDTDTPLS